MTSAEISAAAPSLEYSPTSFSQGRMDFAWAELSEEERQRAYAQWDAGKGLIGGDPRHRPHAHLLPDWGLNQPFFRALALDDRRGDNGSRLHELLATDRSLEIEVGFGRGDFLLDRAKRHATSRYIGYETKNKATRLCLQRLQRYAIDNIWLSDDDCRFNLPRVIADGRVEIFHILFPDPWWKPQHKVKRLFSPPFVDLLAAKLHSGGLLHFKSDVREYGEFVRYLVEQQGSFALHDPTQVARIGETTPTHREHWCQRHGRQVDAYYFVRR